MARYIDADVLIEELKELQKLPSPSLAKTTNDAIDLGLSLAMRTARKAPTADVKEVKRGHWIAKASTHISKRGRLIHYHRYKCSECGVWNGRHKQDFCPHCGADMRGDSDGNL